MDVDQAKKAIGDVGPAGEEVISDGKEEFVVGRSSAGKELLEVVGSEGLETLIEGVDSAEEEVTFVAGMGSAEEADSVGN